VARGAESDGARTSADGRQLKMRMSGTGWDAAPASFSETVISGAHTGEYVPVAKRNHVTTQRRLVGLSAMVAGTVTAATLCSPAGQATPDPTSEAMAGTYQVTFDNGNTQTWNIRAACKTMVLPCVTVTRPDGVQEADTADGRWTFHVYADPNASKQTVYSWDPATLRGTIVNIFKGPCNYRACDYHNEPAGSFTMTKTG